MSSPRTKATPLEHDGADFRAGIARAFRLTERINELGYDDRDALRAAWGELTGREPDERFTLIPPFYCDHGLDIRIGRNVFINQGCALYDLGGIEIGDDVMLGPGVRLISSGHPLEPSLRRSQVTVAPISIGRNVWIASGAQVLQGVTIGADAVIGAGAVVTRDIPAATLAVGVPAAPVRDLSGPGE